MVFDYSVHLQCPTRKMSIDLHCTVDVMNITRVISRLANIADPLVILLCMLILPCPQVPP